jgi:ABC-type lipoprotein release transport system permease subunit
MNSHASFWEAVKGAVQSLRGSKLRSFLTLLGIILATTTLIAVMSVISAWTSTSRRMFPTWAPTATACSASP